MIKNQVHVHVIFRTCGASVYDHFLYSAPNVKQILEDEKSNKGSRSTTRTIQRTKNL